MTSPVFIIYFLRLWLRWLFGGLGALLLERALLGRTDMFDIVAVLTVVVVVIVMWLIVDWNAAHRRGVDYRYDIKRRSTR
jgi:hypothetical protein